MKKQVLMMVVLFAFTLPLHSEDHVIAAASHVPSPKVPATLALDITQAEDYAVASNRSLRNAELSVQQAYAQRWQTIAAMLPQIDGGISKTMMLTADFVEQTMPQQYGGGSMSPWTYSITASIGINGQAVVGAILNSLAIDMQKINLESSERDLRANVRTSYISLLVLRDVVQLLDSSLANLHSLAQITQRSVDVGAAEQTSADLIMVRVNTLSNNIKSYHRSIQLAENSLKVLLDVPVETNLILTTTIADLTSAEEMLRVLGEDFILENNLTYQTIAKNAQLAQANVHMAGWAYGPTVSLAMQSAKRDYGSNGESLMAKMQAPHTVSFSVSMPLWSSGKRAAGVIDKKIAYEQALNTLEETKDNLAIQNQQMRYNLQNAYETFVTETENLDVTRRVFASTTNKYNYGASSNLDLVNASNDVINAQSTYVNALLTFVQAKINLENFLNNK